MDSLEHSEQHEVASVESESTFKRASNEYTQVSAWY